MAGTLLPASGLGGPGAWLTAPSGSPAQDVLHLTGGVGVGGSQEPPSVCDRCEQAPRGQADMPACDVPRGKG